MAVTHDSAQHVRQQLVPALDEALGAFAGQILHAQQDAADQARKRWEQWQTALSQNARVMQSQQQELIRQGEVMARVMEATGEVVKLEAALNENLQVLGGAKNFEDTVMSLAAAIHLLNTRLGTADPRRVELEQKQDASQGRAA